MPHQAANTYFFKKTVWEAGAVGEAGHACSLREHLVSRHFHRCFPVYAKWNLFRGMIETWLFSRTDLSYLRLN